MEFDFWAAGMMESGEYMSLDGGYGVDGGKSGENIGYDVPVALEFPLSSNL